MPRRPKRCASGLEAMGRLAVDIGGTFTDLVHFDEESGSLEAEKSLSTPRDLTQGVLNTIDLSGIEPRDVSFFVHGGTTVINAITDRDRGASHDAAPPTPPGIRVRTTAVRPN